MAWRQHRCGAAADKTSSPHSCDIENCWSKWLVQMHEYLQDNPGLTVNGFRKASIQEAIDSTNETMTANDSLETVTAVNSTDTTVISSIDNAVIEINSPLTKVFLTKLTLTSAIATCTSFH